MRVSFYEKNGEPVINIITIHLIRIDENRKEQAKKCDIFKKLICVIKHKNAWFHRLNNQVEKQKDPK